MDVPSGDTKHCESVPDRGGFFRIWGIARDFTAKMAKSAFENILKGPLKLHLQTEVQIPGQRWREGEKVVDRSEGERGRDGGTQEQAGRVEEQAWLSTRGLLNYLTSCVCPLFFSFSFL